MGGLPPAWYRSVRGSRRSRGVLHGKLWSILHGARVQPVVAVVKGCNASCRVMHLLGLHASRRPIVNVRTKAASAAPNCMLDCLSRWWVEVPFPHAACVSYYCVYLVEHQVECERVSMLQWLCGNSVDLVVQ
jgi:hypothetical protein